MVAVWIQGLHPGYIGLQPPTRRLQPEPEQSAHMLPDTEVALNSPAMWNSARANGGAPAGCTTTQNSMPAELAGLLCTAVAACRQVGTAAPLHPAPYAPSAPNRTAARPLSAAYRSSVGPLVHSVLSARWLPEGLLPCQSMGGHVFEDYRTGAGSRSGSGSGSGSRLGVRVRARGRGERCRGRGYG